MVLELGPHSTYNHVVSVQKSYHVIYFDLFPERFSIPNKVVPGAGLDDMSVCDARCSQSKICRPYQEFML